MRTFACQEIRGFQVAVSQLLDTHPYPAPLCYVKPTPDMQVIKGEKGSHEKSIERRLVQVKVSKHVDAAGK